MGSHPTLDQNRDLKKEAAGLIRVFFPMFSIHLSAHGNFPDE